MHDIFRYCSKVQEVAKTDRFAIQNFDPIYKLKFGHLMVREAVTHTKFPLTYALNWVLSLSNIFSLNGNLDLINWAINTNFLNQVCFKRISTPPV